MKKQILSDIMSYVLLSMVTILFIYSSYTLLKWHNDSLKIEELSTKIIDTVKIIKKAPDINTKEIIKSDEANTPVTKISNDYNDL